MRITTWLIFTLTFFAVNVNGQIIADFESSQSTPALATQTGDATNVATNPTKSGNPSDHAAYYKKAAGDWHALILSFSQDINIGQADRLTFKIYSSIVGRVYVKLDNGSTVLHEDWAPDFNTRPAANTWTECTFDISSLKNQNFNKLEINGAVDGSGGSPVAADIYLDDFRLSNSRSPNGEPVASFVMSPTTIVAGQAVHFDASASIDYDGTINSYRWDFGDGATATGSIVDHTFSDDGFFRASLTVVDNDAKTAVNKMLIPVFPASGKIGSVTFLTSSPERFEKVEGAFLINTAYVNVFDPDEVSVDAIITLPDATTLNVPCFFYNRGYYQATGNKWVADTSPGYWMVRFSSSQSGLHKVVITVTDADGSTQSSENFITITAGSHKGYVQVDKTNRQYYRHTTGEPFYPLGINEAWDNITNYTNTFTALSKGNANFVRYWQVPFNSQALEWRNGYTFYKGIGKYSQEAAAEQDSVIALCEKNNVYLQITLFQHGMFSENVDTNWSDNPYNSANGGPLTRAEQFFYTDAVKKQTKKLLRYIVARWGYSRNIFAWELFNEVQFTGINGSQTQAWKDGVLTWHDEMGQYIKSIDAFHHTVTSSYDDAGIIKLDKLTGLDVVQYHLYDPNLLTVQVTKDKDFLGKLTRTGLINGEYGLNVTTADVPMDAQRIAIWTGIMTQVPHIMWLWNNYSNQDWADLFKYPAAYLATEDLAGESNLANWNFTSQYTGAGLSCVGFGNGKNYYGVLYDASNRTGLQNVQLDLSTLPSARYQFTFTDGTTGISKDSTSDVFSTTRFVLPTFSKVLAFKAKYVSETIGEPPVIAGIDEPESSSIVYPNPTHGEIFLNVSSMAGAVIDIGICDVTGRKIVSVKRTPADITNGYVVINLKKYNLQAGVYIVRFGNDHMSEHKIVYAE